MTSFLGRLREPGACLFGTWSKIASMEVVQILGDAGFDFIVIDMEHAPYTHEAAYRTIVQAQACGMAALVRLPDHGAGDGGRLLDAGADGVLVPRVQTVEQARAVLGPLAFPPQGSRGMGYTSRASRWGADSVPSYLEGGRDILRCAQLEDEAALEQIDALLDVETLNAVFIGFGDLSLSTGLPPSDPRLRAHETRVLAAARKRGAPCGVAVQTPADAERCRDAGYSFVMVSADTTMLVQQARGLAAKLPGKTQ